MLKRNNIEIPVTRNFNFAFEIGGNIFPFDVISFDEKNALSKLKENLLLIIKDIDVELSGIVEMPAPNVVEEDRSSGVKIKREKPLNNTGFQPNHGNFVEKVD